jgi:[ribosomal protein S5]-alanine N-acetyltransferase
MKMIRLRIKSGMLENERIYLRKLTARDVNERYCGWMNDPQVNRFLESRFQSHSIKSLKAFLRCVQNDKHTVFFAIILKNGDRHIGNIKLGPINTVHSCADIGILIGEKDCWGKGYATDAIVLLVEYAFRSLNLHKVTAGCYAPNVGSLKAFRKAGFLQEGFRIKHCLCEGKYVDDILLGRINKNKPEHNLIRKGKSA